ncbi:MAG: hypothetical protein PG981_001074 [Wolbachia endosymbiont of Ctenocephalides orientis wCori]|nr:MAG: hypothetical protein PG981_001074 [Wolbachia endosymbiont of Ctenocephalides orientis wCori]
MVEDNRKNISCESGGENSGFGKMYGSLFPKEGGTNWRAAFHQQQELLKQLEKAKAQNIPCKTQPELIKEQPESTVESIMLEEKIPYTQDKSR